MLEHWSAWQMDRSGRPGISPSGVIGETILAGTRLCSHRQRMQSPAPIRPKATTMHLSIRAWLEPPPSLEYLPGETPRHRSLPFHRAPAEASMNRRSAGCDQSTNYQCGVPKLFRIASKSCRPEREPRRRHQRHHEWRHLPDPRRRLSRSAARRTGHSQRVGISISDPCWSEQSARTYWKRHAHHK